MKIDKIKINKYGKLKNKEINFKKFNLIYGKNESGKSTLLNYLIDIFFGISKNKNGKKISNYDKYTPWNENEFSGSIEYELDDNKKFYIFRNFFKKNPEIFDENNNEITKQFSIHKTEGCQPILDQIGIDKKTILSTVISNQNNTVIDQNAQNQLLQKIANLTESGEEEISYKQALCKLEKMQLTEIGTDRSLERPINIVRKNINTLKKKIEEIKKYKNQYLEYDNNKNKIIQKIEEEKNNKIIYEKINKLINKNNIENEKIKIKKKLIEENNKKIEKKYLEKKSIKKNNKNSKIKLIIFIIIIFFNLIQICFIKNKIINLLFILIIPMYLIYFFIKIKANNIKLIEQQIDILEKNNLELITETNNMQEELIKNNNIEKNNLISLYGNNIRDLFISEISEIIKDNFEIINELELQLHKLELEKNNIEEKIEKLNEYEEKLDIEEENLRRLEEQNKIFEITKEILSSSYENMKQSVTPKFSDNLSKNLEKFSDYKYKKIVLRDDIRVELENGQRIQIEQLSEGTIQQIYLALRLSVINEISSEILPIILDETFAYYDDDRLKQTLLFLLKLPNQVIIMSCTDREKKILDEIKAEYNYIEL